MSSLLEEKQFRIKEWHKIYRCQSVWMEGQFSHNIQYKGYFQSTFYN